jgi:hypothetical protein
MEEGQPRLLTSDGTQVKSADASPPSPEGAPRKGTG